jgi:hypothetical protein
MREPRPMRDRALPSLFKRLLWGWSIIGLTMVAFATFSLGFSRALRIFAPGVVLYSILEVLLFLSRSYIGKGRPDVGGS